MTQNFNRRTGKTLEDLWETDADDIAVYQDPTPPTPSVFLSDAPVVAESVPTSSSARLRALTAAAAEATDSRYDKWKI